MKQKLLLKIAGGLVALSVFLVTGANQLVQLVNSNKQENLRATAAQHIRLNSSASASTSPTYFGAGGTANATSTELTLGCSTAGNKLGNYTLQDVERVGVFVQQTSSTSPAITLIQPEVSNDCVDWYAVGGLADQVTTAGSAVNGITLPNASSTVLQWSPGSVGVNKTSFELKNLNSFALRFRVNGNVASSTVWLQTTQIVKAK